MYIYIKLYLIDILYIIRDHLYINLHTLIYVYELKIVLYYLKKIKRFKTYNIASKINESPTMIQNEKATLLLPCIVPSSTQYSI